MEKNISELKAKLNHYLKLVRAGQVVTILDRSTPVAELRGIGKSNDELEVIEPTIGLNEALDILDKTKGHSSSLSSVELCLEDRARRF